MQFSFRILYVAGSMRSGSTLLSRLLATADGVGSIGEMGNLWTYGFEENAICSCGHHFFDCEFWTEVLKQAGVDNSVAREILDLERRVARVRHYFFHLTGLYPPWVKHALARLTDHYARLYHSLARVAGVPVIVESSKSPARALMLGAAMGMDVSVIHLVRNPKATVHSAAKNPKWDPSLQRPMRQRSVLGSSILWLAVNLMAAGLRFRVPYVRVRYEDVVEDPSHHINLVLGRVGVGPRVSFDGRSVAMPAGHSLGGNPDRFDTGRIAIRRDRSAGTWRRRDSLLITIITWPLARLYGYRLSI
jgi:hypothetical protein